MTVGPQRKARGGEPVQLDMLKPARELWDMHSMDTAAYGGSRSRMREAKMDENEMTGLTEDVAASGSIQKPVQILHGKRSYWGSEMESHTMAIGNGNHRVTAAMMVNPNMEVPVIHHDQFNDYIEHHTEVDEDY